MPRSESGSRSTSRKSRKDKKACINCKRKDFEPNNPERLCAKCDKKLKTVNCVNCNKPHKQLTKYITETAPRCARCREDIQTHGEPRRFTICAKPAAFTSQLCRRCTKSHAQYGEPVSCGDCYTMCAFNRGHGTSFCYDCTNKRKARSKRKAGMERGGSKTKREEKSKRSDSKKSPNKRTADRKSPRKPKKQEKNSMSGEELSRHHAELLVAVEQQEAALANYKQRGEEHIHDCIRRVVECRGEEAKAKRELKVTNEAVQEVIKQQEECSAKMAELQSQNLEETRSLREEFNEIMEENAREISELQAELEACEEARYGSRIQELVKQIDEADGDSGRRRVGGQKRGKPGSNMNSKTKRRRTGGGGAGGDSEEEEDVTGEADIEGLGDLSEEEEEMENATHL